MMKKITRFGIYFIISTVCTLYMLKLANDVGGLWINISWAFGVMWGLEVVGFWEAIQEHNEQKPLTKE